jgi:ribosome-binding factor A
VGKHPEKRGGESHRLARVEREIRDVVGTYLLGGFKGDLPGFVSLTRVVCSADLKLARCHITLLLNKEENETDEAFEKRQTEARKEAVRELNEHTIEVQHRISQVLQMRFTPKITFYYDEGYESAMKVEKILRDMTESAKAPGTAGDDSADSDSGADERGSGE